GADLDFKRIAVRTDHRRMEGLVHVRLRHGDVILEAPRHRFPYRMDDTEYRIAVPDARDQHPDGEQVEYLIELFMLFLHLLVDAVDVLRPSLQLPLEPRLSHCGFDAADCTVDDALLQPALLFHHVHILEIL